jgi:archaemetzincin
LIVKKIFCSSKNGRGWSRTPFFPTKLYNIHFDDELLSKSKRAYDGYKILAKYDNNQNMMVITKETLSTEVNGKELLQSGLAETPGNMSVVSTYRIDSGVPVNLLISRMKKLVLHEIGHNFGLYHCSNKVCVMYEDCKSDEQKLWFCDKCKMRLPEK